jgi:hypothetical protein
MECTGCKGCAALTKRKEKLLAEQKRIQAENDKLTALHQEKVARNAKESHGAMPCDQLHT